MGQVPFYRDIVPLPRDDGSNRCRVFTLQRDRFNPLDFFAGEHELFGLEVFFHMLLTRGSGQWEHADLHGKAKDDLSGTRAQPFGDRLNFSIGKDFSIGG